MGSTHSKLIKGEAWEKSSDLFCYRLTNPFVYRFKLWSLGACYASMANVGCLDFNDSKSMGNRSYRCKIVQHSTEPKVLCHSFCWTRMRSTLFTKLIKGTRGWQKSSDLFCYKLTNTKFLSCLLFPIVKPRCLYVLMANVGRLDLKNPHGKEK